MLEPTFRPLITVIRVTPDRSSLEVVLDLDGRTASAVVDVEDDDSLVAACRATVKAVQQLLPDHLVLVHDWVRTIDDDDIHTINSAVTLTLPRDDQVEHLLGAAYVRSDPDVAAVRATLDGLTRRLVNFLFD